jgi:hypothetical protein
MNGNKIIYIISVSVADLTMLQESDSEISFAAAIKLSIMNEVRCSFVLTVSLTHLLSLWLSNFSRV